jgi:hypothetical protein
MAVIPFSLFLVFAVVLFIGFGKENIPKPDPYKEEKQIGYQENCDNGTLKGIMQNFAIP